MPAPTATIVIGTIGTQTANTPFAVAGTYALSSSTWNEQLSYEDDSGAIVPINTAPIALKQVAFSFIHPGLPVGTHTVSIKDPYTGTVVQSNMFTVDPAETIVSDVPAGVVAGQPFTFTGTLTGFATAPPLTYRFDGGPSQTLTGVTTSGWSMVLTGPVAGSHTLLVIDGAVSAAPVSFTVAPASANHTIAPNAPTGVIAGKTFTFSGALGGYTAAPSLAYQINAGAKVALTGVTTTGWSMTITAPTTPANYTITVTDGTTQASVQFSVSAPPKTITPYQPPSTQAGKLFTFTGVLNNYTTIPALTYQINTATPVAMTGVSVSGWSMTVAAPANAGSYTITVSDGTVSGSTTLTVTKVTAATRRYQDQPGTNANVWNIPIGDGATYGAPTDADTIAARHGGAINTTANYGAAFWDANANTNNTPVTFTGHGGDYANPLYAGTGQPFNITAECVIGSYSPGPYPADNQYAFIDEINHPGKYIQFGPLAIQNLQPGLPTQAAYFGGIEDAMSDTFAQDWETGNANFSQTAGVVRGYDLDPTRNQARIPGTSLTRIQHVLRYAHDPIYLKSNANSNTTVNPDYPNGFLNPTSWPQLYQDFQSNNNIYTGDLIYGTQLFIPMSTPFPTSLVGNAAAQQLFDCLQRYGSITRDAASGGYTLYTDQTVSSTWASQAQAALPTLVQLLVPMRNQHQGGQSFTTNPINGPGNRLDVGPPPLAPIGGGSTPTAITWNANDIAGGMTLDTTDYIATAAGSTTPGSTPQGVRAIAAISSTGPVAWEVVMTALTQNWAAGVADKTYSLINPAGIGFDTHAMGAYPSTGTGSQPAQTVYYNNAQLTAGNGVADAAGDVMSIVVNGTNFYFSTPSMRTTSGVTWNNSSTADPIKNVGGFSFAGISTPYYPVFSEGEGGGKGTLNDGTSAFSAFMTLFLNQNPSVVTLSGQVTTSGPQIQANTPANVVAGSPFTFNGSISGYKTIPALTYQVNNGTAHPLTGVTLSGWSETLTITSTGTTTITVSDGTINNVVSFTITTGGTGINRVVAPLTGSVTTGSWVAVDLPVSGVTLASGKPFHFEYLLPAQYNPNVVYPVLFWLHPDTEGDPWYNGSDTNPNYLSGADANGWFNTVSFRTNYPCIVVVPYADQTANGQGDGNDAVENWGGWVNNGTVGSGTNYSGDTGPNVFALVDGVVPYLQGKFSVDATRIYSQGFSLGAIGTEYLMLKYNTVNGLKKVFAAGVSCGGGVLEIHGMGAGPSSADVTASQSPPIWNICGQQDGTSIPSDWNLPMWQAITGNTNYPTDITTAAASRAGSSNYYLSYLPNVGHQQTDAAGNPFSINPIVISWLFNQMSGSSASVNITGATFTPAPTVVQNSAVGTVAGSLKAQSSGGSLTGIGFSLNNTANFAVSGTNLVFNSASVAAGTYPLTLTISATNAANTPQSYPITVAVSGGAGTGNFSVRGGQLYDPNGNLFIARGINVCDFQMSGASTNGQAQPLTTDFPGINFVRLACFDLTQPPAYYQTFITQLTSNGIVVEIEDHTTSTGSNGGGGQGVVFTGTLLTNELNWYANLAAAFANNPYVWFGTNNEPAYNPSISALCTWHQQTYNAIRNAGNNNIIMVCLPAGGNPNTYGSGNMTASVYAPMTNILWDFHQYAWQYNDSNGNNGQTGPNPIAVSDLVSYQLANNAIAQTITSADGVIPIMNGETGESTTGGSLDVSGYNLLAADAQTSTGAVGYFVGFAAFCWGTLASYNALTTDNSGAVVTSPYGTTIAGYI